MAWLGTIAAIALIGVVFIDAFEAMILPRRIRHSYRFAQNFLQGHLVSVEEVGAMAFAWKETAGLSQYFRPPVPFCTFHRLGCGTHHRLRTVALVARHNAQCFSPHRLRLYRSSVFERDDILHAGLRRFCANGRAGSVLSVTEAGIGFGFLAVVISYLPVLHQAFSRREIVISLLDARAGSPPSAVNC